MSDNNQVAVAVKAPVAIGHRGITLSDYDGLVRFSIAVSKSGLAPKGIESPEAIAVAIQMGLEVGLTPMAALQNIAVINGRPSIWGDAQLAVVRATGELEHFEEWFEENGKRLLRNPQVFNDTTAAVCLVKRAGQPAKESSFSVADAKRANLWAKSGPWTQYPTRMLMFRARSFGLRDAFGDALKGMRSAEEERDIAPEEQPKPRRQVQVESAQVSEPARKEASEEIPMSFPTRPLDPPPAQAQETKPAVQTIEQQRDAVWEVVKSKGISFEGLTAWAIEMGEIPGGVQYGSLEEFPDAFFVKWSAKARAFDRALEIAKKGGAKPSNNSTRSFLQTVGRFRLRLPECTALPKKRRRLKGFPRSQRCKHSFSSSMEWIFSLPTT